MCMLQQDSHTCQLCFVENLHTFPWTAVLQNGSFWVITKKLKTVCRKWLVCVQWQESNSCKSALCLGKTLKWKPPSPRMTEIRSCETFCKKKPPTFYCSTDSFYDHNPDLHISALYTVMFIYSGGCRDLYSWTFHKNPQTYKLGSAKMYVFLTF